MGILKLSINSKFNFFLVWEDTMYAFNPSEFIITCSMAQDLIYPTEQSMICSWTIFCDSWVYYFMKVTYTFIASWWTAPCVIIRIPFSLVVPLIFKLRCLMFTYLSFLVISVCMVCHTFFYFFFFFVSFGPSLINIIQLNLVF